jgi:hypothetical protein
MSPGNRIRPERLLDMTTAEYRAEAERLRRLSVGPTVSREDSRHYLDMAAIFDTLANADEAIARSIAIFGPLISD